MNGSELNRLRFIEQQVKDLAKYLRADADMARHGSIPFAGEEAASSLEHAAQRIEDILASAGPQADAIAQAVRQIEAGLGVLQDLSAPGHAVYPGPGR